MRKSFLIHTDTLNVLDILTDEQVGKLFRAIKNYQNGVENILDFEINIAFVPFKNQFDRDTEKYENIVERNAINGSKGGRPRNPKNPVGYLETQENPKKPKKADSDSDSDSDSVNDNYQYNHFVLDFQKIVGKQMKGNEKTQKMFSARLKEGFTKEQFCRAIANCKNDKWHIENPQYLTIEFILRNDKLEKYLNIVPEPTKSTGLTLEQAQARMRGELI